MVNSVPMPPAPVNEPILGYLPGSEERLELEAEVKRQSSEILEIPCVINGEEIFTEGNGHLYETVLFILSVPQLFVVINSIELLPATKFIVAVTIPDDWLKLQFTLAPFTSN